MPPAASSTVSPAHPPASLDIDHKTLLIMIDVDQAPVDQALPWLAHVRELIVKTWPAILENPGVTESDDFFHTLRITTKSPPHAQKLKKLLENLPLFQNSALAQPSPAFTYN